jgi:hypothetical protein
MTKTPTPDDVPRKVPKPAPKPHEAALKVKGKAARAESHKGNKVQPAYQKRTGFKGR